MLYNPDGRTKQVRPSNGTNWTREELRAFVGGYFALTRTIDGEFMVINDQGKFLGLELNYPATRIYVKGRKDPILGPALVVYNPEELQDPDSAQV